MCLYLSVWERTKSVSLRLCALVPHGPAVDLHRSPFILQIYGPLFTPSSFFLPVNKTLYIQYFPLLIEDIKGALWYLLTVGKCSSVLCKQARETLCELYSLCGGQRVCLPPNYDITASHASLGVSTYCTAASLLLSREPSTLSLLLKHTQTVYAVYSEPCTDTLISVRCK